MRHNAGHSSVQVTKENDYKQNMGHEINYDNIWKIESYYFLLDGLESLKFTMEGVLMTLVGIFGLLGNILGLIILTRPQMRRLPINLILIGKLKVN